MQQPHDGPPLAPDYLQVRRLMEEDNRKARKAARKAYNEAGKCCTECAVHQAKLAHVQLPASSSDLQRLSLLGAAWRSPAV